MSVEDYCPEVHNDPDFEVIETSDTSSEEDPFDKDLKLGDKMNEMIKKEVADKFKEDVPDRMSSNAFKEINSEAFNSLSDLDKINAVAVAFSKTGGIQMENILELKMLMVLIGATETMEGFSNFPREEVCKLLEMIVYHANKHMDSLNV